MPKLMQETGPGLTTRAERLVNASRKASYDPFTEIDWDVEFDDDHGLYLVPEDLPLYGTPAWEAMRHPTRVAYSRHECASLCAAGIWFENILMQLLLRQLYDLPATDGSHHYLLIETADECRHSSMFGEFIRRAGTPSYAVPRRLRMLGRFLVATASGPEAYIAILAAEELLDASNRRSIGDRRLHPVVRGMARVHVAEEARHMSYARAFVTDVWPTVRPVTRWRTGLRAPLAVAIIARALTNPAVYRTVGVRRGLAEARSNPHHRQRVVRDLERLTGLLADVGVITPVTRPLWRALGLIA
jgi:P-aminobenzoate N-oxygenase AurF